MWREKRDKIPVLDGAGLRYANSYSSTTRRVSRCREVPILHTYFSPVITLAKFALE
jgi:hypothetical protein